MSCQNDDARPGSERAHKARIANLNDQLRQGTGAGQAFITEGILAIGEGAVADILTLVASFTEFDNSNDPHQERDYGSFIYLTHKIFWKIDYYDRSLEFGSPDPADPDVTTRVLTIMLAREY
ncbi:DUF3768 domain-containing protein [Citromicrobium bathyomarinum]